MRENRVLEPNSSLGLKDAKYEPFCNSLILKRLWISGRKM